MKQFFIILALLMSVTTTATANQKERLVKLPASFNDFIQNMKDSVDPEKTYMSCRLENPKIGTMIATQPWGKMLHVDDTHFFEFWLESDMMKLFDEHEFSATCWTSMPEGYSCHAVFTPGYYVVDCQ